MKEWIPRFVILFLLAVILGIPFALRPADATRHPVASAGPGAERLVILTPHNEQIRYEFARAFNQWRIKHGHSAIEFDWRSSGGTSDLRKQVLTEFEEAAARGEEDRGIGKDLFFGGGDFEHNTLARGIVVHRNGKEVALPVTEPVVLPPGLLTAAFPEPTIAGVALYRSDMRWVGVVLSSFGIVYNKDVLGMLGLPEPTTWSDMTDVRYRGWLALADPSHSGSIAAAYNVILRRQGWTEGWSTLRRVFANAKYFTASAPKVAVDVSAGEAATGMSIDFFGRFQVGAIGRDRLGYVDPPYMTAVTPDPISILRGPPHRALANEFIAWLLSPGAQRLWQRRMGSEDGPERFELRRMPIRRDLYQSAEMAEWTDRVDPFATTTPLAPGMPDFYSAIAPVVQAMAIDTADDLKAAWAAIVEHPDHPRRAEMVQLFDAMPPELTLTWADPSLEKEWSAILSDPKNPRHVEVEGGLKKFITGLGARYDNWKNAEKVLVDRLRWTRFFQVNYRRVVEMSR